MLADFIGFWFWVLLISIFKQVMGTFGRERKEIWTHWQFCCWTELNAWHSNCYCSVFFLVHSHSFCNQNEHLGVLPVFPLFLDWLKVAWFSLFCCRSQFFVVSWMSSTRQWEWNNSTTVRKKDPSIVGVRAANESSCLRAARESSITAHSSSAR